MTTLEGLATIAIIMIMIRLFQQSFYKAREAHWLHEENHVLAKTRAMSILLDRAKVTEVDGMIFSQWARFDGRIVTEQIVSYKNLEGQRIVLEGDERADAMRLINASIGSGESSRVLSAATLSVDTERWTAATNYLRDNYNFTKKQGNGTYAPMGYTLTQVVDLMLSNKPIPTAPQEAAQV